MALPDSFVEEVRRTADIVRYISEHVALRKAGTSWKGLCPFHNEKTPSFNVRQEPPVFHCFGCVLGTLACAVYGTTMVMGRSDSP